MKLIRNLFLTLLYPLNYPSIAVAVLAIIVIIIAVRIPTWLGNHVEHEFPTRHVFEKATWTSRQGGILTLSTSEGVTRQAQTQEFVGFSKGEFEALVGSDDEIRFFMARVRPNFECYDPYDVGLERSFSDKICYRKTD